MASSKRKVQGAEPHVLPEVARARVRALIDKVGEVATAKALGCSRPTIERALAALPIRQTSIRAIELSLEKVA